MNKKGKSADLTRFEEDRRLREEQEQKERAELEEYQFFENQRKVHIKKLGIEKVKLKLHQEEAQREKSLEWRKEGTEVVNGLYSKIAGEVFVKV